VSLASDPKLAALAAELLAVVAKRETAEREAQRPAFDRAVHQRSIDEQRQHAKQARQAKQDERLRGETCIERILRSIDPAIRFKGSVELPNTTVIQAKLPWDPGVDGRQESRHPKPASPS
jgi:hypothetical protein